jgi:hypothetical protein
VSLPHSVLKHPAFATLTPRATKLLIDLATQYRGKNNGDLSMPLSQMRNRGWNSSDQLQKAKNELIERGFIAVSRQGGRNKCSLYAVTWQPIDDCKGKLDINSTYKAQNLWKGWKASPKKGSK